MNVQRPTPAIVSQNAVRALPRPVLWALVLVYVCAGFIGRHPWKSEDMAAYGYMHALAQGHTTWLRPDLLGLPLEPAPALLPVWLGALALRLAPPWLDPQLAVRLPFMGLLLLAFVATWYATYYLARRPAAQPVPFAFGGEARPADYARAIADGSVLALIACFGLVQFSHEAAASVMQLLGASILFLALAALARRPRMGGALGVLALLVLLGSGAGLWATLACAVLGLWLLAVQHPERAVVMPLLAVPVALAYTWAALVWLASMGQGWPHMQTWLNEAVQWRYWSMGAFEPARVEPGAQHWQSLGRALIWFGWPAWPLMCWAIYRWRAHIFTRQPAFHLLLPLAFLLPTLALAVLAQSAARDRLLFLGLPMAAALAAFALPTLGRAVSALIDWFTMLFFTVCGIAIWVIWTATQTGIPAKPAANVARLAPEYVPVFSPLAFVLALLATLVWLAVVRWRTGRHQAALWKSLVLPAGGATWCLVLVMTLWLPMLDYGRSYQPHIDKLRAHIRADIDCIWPYGLSRAQLAALTAQAGWPLRALPTAQQAQQAGATCSMAVLALAPAGGAADIDAALQAAGWQRLAVVERPTSDEALALYTPAAGQALPALPSR